MTKESPEDPSAKVRAIFGDTVTAKPIRPESGNEEHDAIVGDLLTRVCYFYPQYTLEQAEQLTDSQVTALLVQAEKQRAVEWYNHTMIAAAPHTKKGKLVKKLLKEYKKIAEM